MDYLGLAHELKGVLATYTESGGRGRTASDQDEAVAVMLEKCEVCCGLFHGFDRSAWVAGTSAEKLGLLPAAQEHVLAQEDGKERTIRAVRELSLAFALSVPHDEALRIRDEVGFFQAVQSVLAKRTLRRHGYPPDKREIATRTVLEKAEVLSGGWVGGRGKIKHSCHVSARAGQGPSC